MTEKLDDAGTKFAPCPFCKQYSHSISDDQVADAHRHFQSMYAHPVRGHPMGDIFDEQTQDAAQVLIAAARENIALREAMGRIVGNANEAMPLGPLDCIDNHGEPYQSQAFAEALEAGRKLLAALKLSEET